MHKAHLIESVIAIPFVPPKTGCELAQLLRQVADQVDRDEVVWKSWRAVFETEEGTPVKDVDGKLWRTHKHSGLCEMWFQWNDPRKTGEDG